MPLNTDISDIIERRNLSRDYQRANYWDEFTEVFRGIMCRTKPIMKRDESGRETTEEDTTRTNVAGPELNLIFRRNVARMTSRPPTLNYLGGDEMMAEMQSSLAKQQYDRSNEANEHRRVVMFAEAFGQGISKLWNDKVEPIRLKRVALVHPVTGQVMHRDRRAIMEAQGAPSDEVSQAVSELGENMSDDEVAQVTQSSLNDITLRESVLKYEGPMLKAVFPGDFFFEPGVGSIDDSDWQIESYQETDLWLQKGVKDGYLDPDVCDELISLDPGPDQPDQKIADLKQMFRGVLNLGTPRVEKRLLAHKKFDILEQHKLNDDGQMEVTWISEKLTDKPLGKLVYPFDLYGQSVYDELVPLPSMIGAVGDSTPRLLRYLYYLLNFSAAQNFDYIANVLSPLIIRDSKTDAGQDIIKRGMFRELVVSSMNGVKIESLPPLPPGSFDRINLIRSQMGQAEPSMNQIEAGTNINPMAGKTATTAMLASKAADALLQFKIDGQDQWLRKVGQKKLWMNQQSASDAFTIQQQYFTAKLKEAVTNGQLPKWAADRAEIAMEQQASMTDKLNEHWGLSSRNGNTVAIRLDVREMQEDYQVEPESGSYLSVDDELKKQTAMDLQQVATANPGLLDQRKIATVQLKTIRNLGAPPESFLLPQQPPDPMAQAKLSASLSIKFETLEAGAQTFFLGQLGYQENPADTQAKQQLEGIRHMSEAADHATNLLSPAEKQPNESEVSVSPRAAAASA